MAEKIKEGESCGSSLSSGNLESASDNIYDFNKTNNIGEIWYNRFRIAIGKHQPDLYSALSSKKNKQIQRLPLLKLALVEK